MDTSPDRSGSRFRRLYSTSLQARGTPLAASAACARRVCPGSQLETPTERARPAFTSSASASDKEELGRWIRDTTIGTLPEFKNHDLRKIEVKPG